MITFDWQLGDARSSFSQRDSPSGLRHAVVRTESCQPRSAAAVYRTCVRIPRLVSRRPPGPCPVDDLTQLELGLALTRPGARRRLAGWLKPSEGMIKPELLDSLSSDDRGAVRGQAEDLAGRGVGVLLRGQNNYPAPLRNLSSAPWALFYSGNLSILSRSAIGICGSRNVTPDGLRAASACGELAAKFGLASVSGYARGVDTATHVGSLAYGGDTIIVLPEGINHFRVKKNGIGEFWDSERTLVVSQFAPTQPWSVNGAMARNGVIIGLGMALVVVEAGETGGTLAAGKKALEMGRRVLSLEFSTMPTGNEILISSGAVPVRGRDELGLFMSELKDLHHDIADVANSGLTQDYLQTVLPF